jgi:hypothetical protein
MPKKEPSVPIFRKMLGPHSGQVLWRMEPFLPLLVIELPTSPSVYSLSYPVLN